MAQKRFSLTKKIKGAIDINEDDFLYSVQDLARETRTQSLGTCWTYPTINSFETSLISNGLVSSPSEFEGSEWHIALNQTSGPVRKIDFKRESDNFEVNFGGLDHYGIFYFATGRNGAAVPQTRDERNNVLATIRAGKKFHDREVPFPDPSRLPSIYPDPYQQRQYGYDAGIILDDDIAVKNYIQKNEVSGQVSYRSPAASSLDFIDYMVGDSQTYNDSGDLIKDWIDPKSLKLLDKQGSRINIRDLLEHAAKDSVLNRRDLELSLSIFSNSRSSGVVENVRNTGSGHAVTLLGWDDTYVAPTVDKLSVVFEGLSPRDNPDGGEDLPGLSKSTIKSLSDWAKSEGYEYTNKGNTTKGAWFIQNSWGQKGKNYDNEFQYLPYNFAEEQKVFHAADKTGLYGRVDSSTTSSSLIKNATAYDEIGYQFDYNSDEVIAAVGVYIEKSSQPSRIKAELYRVGELDSAPIASTEYITPHVGYQTLRFDAPVKVDEAAELVAVVSQEDPSARNLNAYSYYGVEEIVQQASTEYTPDQLNFWEDLPLYYNNLIQVDGGSIARDVYFGRTGDAWNDVGASGDAVFLNVVYANQENMLTDKVDVITGNSDSDQIFVNDEGNTIDASNGDDSVFVRFADNIIRLGDGNDTVIATEARGKDLVIHGGEGDDRYVFSLGKGNHFKGAATIKDLEEGDIVYLYQFKDDDIKSVVQREGATIFDFGSFELKIKGATGGDVAFNDGLIGMFG